ncbi:MAG: molybdate ABC transporter permease subunit [Sulfuricaulis sp.]
MTAAIEWSALWLTLQLAMITTALLLMIGTPLAWWLARAHSRLKTVIEAVVALPLVLPPTVLGFYLLLALAPDGPVGGLWRRLGGSPLVFSFSGLVFGSVIYSLPFAIQPLQAAFAAVSRGYLEAAATLRAAPLDRFFSVAVPLARPGFLTAAVLAFAHTLGEFGVVLMIGGNIPNRTRVISIAIYDYVETIHYRQAHQLSAVVLALSFVLLLIVYTVNRRLVYEP